MHICLSSGLCSSWAEERDRDRDRSGESGWGRGAARGRITAERKKDSSKQEIWYRKRNLKVPISADYCAFSNRPSILLSPSFPSFPLCFHLLDFFSLSSTFPCISYLLLIIHFTHTFSILFSPLIFNSYFTFYLTSFLPFKTPFIYISHSAIFCILRFPITEYSRKRER